MKVAEFINNEIAEIMRKEIEDSGGNEVFFRGVPDEE